MDIVTEENKSDKALCDEGNLDVCEDEGVCKLLVGMFRGPLWWTAVLVLVESLIVLGLMVFVAIKFFAAETTRDMIMLATIFLGLMMIMLLVKIWSWMLMFRNASMKRIKRLECSMAALMKMIAEK